MCAIAARRRAGHDQHSGTLYPLKEDDADLNKVVYKEQPLPLGKGCSL
jgi:hypothetical protein